MKVCLFSGAFSLLSGSGDKLRPEVTLIALTELFFRLRGRQAFGWELGNKMMRAACLLAIWGFASWLSGQEAERYPQEANRKGLQVQMVDDALELGIGQAALNFNLGQLFAPEAAGRDDQRFVTVKRGEIEYSFQRQYLEQMDALIRPLSDRGVVVSLILLNYFPADEERQRILVHPEYSPECPNRLAAFNTRTPEGRAWLEAAIELLAQRWGTPGGMHGRVWNWIVGNEVNSHWFWCNQGRVSMEAFAGDYLDAVRLVHRAVRRYSAEGRVFVSLEHHWNIRYGGGDELQTFPAREFLEFFAARARAQGDFDWHVAFHPYPENLFEPRTWLDRTATGDWRTTPRITFRNLGVLLEFLQQPELQFAGQPRRVILSEQGFHTADESEGESLQAAAYCYAWKKVQSLEGVDAFILHRHVDHAQEGGLRLGLWTRRAESVSDPERKKLMYDVFRAAGTAAEDEVFQFALPIIGLKEWGELAPDRTP